MGTIIKIDQETITLELANAIASFNIDKVAELLSETGEYCIQDEKEETVPANKANFIKWLSKRFDEFLSAAKDRIELNFITDRCSYCRIGNPVIIFENGKFPVNMKDPWDCEKCGLMLEFDGNLVSGISFCYYFLTTENPFNYERKCSRFNY